MSSDGRSTTAIDAPPSSVRVLIAEDDADLRGVLSRNLSANGHVIVAEVATITEVIAAMNPPSAPPKMTTIVCSSAWLQPPHIRRQTSRTEQVPQNIPAAAASQP